ncbi:MAG: hypothetical protein FJX72_00260 [Armatimonadetes bacterium]|nr:hypothetical protein [Armatimonadota bacterium]
MRPLVLLAVGLAVALTVGGYCMDAAFSVAPEAAARSHAILPEASARVRSYTAIRWTLYAASTVWFFGGLYILVRWRLAVCILTRLPSRLHRRPFVAGMLVWAAMASFLAPWGAPASLAHTAVEKAFGLSTISPGLWVTDRAMGWCLQLAWAPVAGLAIALIRKSPKGWWAWMATAAAPLAIVVTLIYPVFIDPMFNTFRSLQDAGLRARLEALAHKAGIGEATVLVSNSSRRTRRANAYVTGLGPTHRIVLWDTILKYPHDQIEAITAHEIGHYRLHHIWWGLGLHLLGGFVVLWSVRVALDRVVTIRGLALGIRSVADPAVLPLAYLVLQICLTVQMPAASAVSRLMERQADAYGLRLCGDGAATARAFAAFSTTDLADPDPSPVLVAWCYTHPPLRERVAKALEFAGAGHRGEKLRLHGLRP